MACSSCPARRRRECSDAIRASRTARARARRPSFRTHDAEPRYTPFSAAISVCHAAEAGPARGVLLDLAERLRAPRPVDPDGVRLAGELLVDGCGPLYAATEPGDLHAAALRALRALDGHGSGR